LMALNMVYRAKYGGMQGQELADLLNGNSTGLSPDIQNLVGQLVGLVNRFMPSKTRAETLAQLMDYVDSKDSVDSMLETSNLFASFLSPDVDGLRLASVKT
jgi:hypothetical protein